MPWYKHPFFAKYKKIIQILSVFVVFLTTYALILPAITLNKETATEKPGIELPETTTSSSLETLTSSGKTDKETTPESEQESVSLITEERTLEHHAGAYTTMVDIDAAAQLPEGVHLEVSEIPEGSESYQLHYDQTVASLQGQVPNSARFFHISLMHNGEEIEPKSEVRVRFHYSDPLTIEPGNGLLAVHFLEEQVPEILTVTSRQVETAVSDIQFKTESFSPFGVIETNATRASTSPSGKTYHQVRFEVDGQEVTSISNVESGSKLGTLPDVPFKADHRFLGWRNKDTGQDVTTDTEVTSDMTIEAVFENINIYHVEIQYYYTKGSDGSEPLIDKEIYQLEESDTPFRVTPPASFDVSPADDPSLTSATTYYPRDSIVEISRNQLANLDQQDGNADKQIVIRVPFIPANASFNYVYWLKNLTGPAYTRIQTVPARGVLGTTITPNVLTYPHAEFERAGNLQLTQASGQNLHIFYTRKPFTLSYESNGGSYVAPQAGVYGQTMTINPQAPTRQGYTFDGWYTTSNFVASTKVGATVPLNQDTTLYAKWVPKTVPYTIVYYKEQYDNATNTTSFEYDSSAGATGLVGSVVTATSAPAIQTDTLGYELDTAQNATSQIEIAPDGTSILKVYYKLKRYTFVFNLNKTTATISMNGGQYRNATYTIPDVVLGRDISRFWPSETAEIRSGDTTTFTGWLGAYRYISRQFNTTTELIATADSSNRVTYTAQWSTGNFIARRVDYYLQSADNPNEYLASQYGQTFNLLYNHNFSAKELEGFEVMTSPPAGYPNHGQNVYRIGFTNRTIVDHYRFYYRRKSYTLRYYYGSQELNSHTVLFDANINKAPYTDPPARPAGVDADYTWGGWYADPDFNSLYEFDKMPQTNVALYARWIAPKYTVNFDVNGGDSALPQAQTVEKGQYATIPSPPERQHYDFAGWYTDPTAGQLYDWNKPVTADTTLYARWKPKPITYRVRYLESGTNQPILADKVVTGASLSKGQIVTETAVPYLGYRPDERTRSLELDYENNVITFYYVKKAPVTTYTVRYVLKSDPTIEVAPSKTLSVDGAWISVKEEAADVNKTHMAQQPGITPDMLALDYYPEAEVQNMLLSADGTNNVITFEYLEYDTAHIILNYLDMDGNPIPGQVPLHVYRRKPGSYSVDRKVIDGYTLDHTVDSYGERDKLDYRVTKSEQIIVNLYYKKKVTLEPKTKEKVYDGTALSLANQVSELQPGYATQLVSGDKITAIAFSGSQTNEGRSASTIQDTALKIVNAAGKDKRYYYDVEARSGSLIVKPVAVTVAVTGQRLEKLYDGTASEVSYTTRIIDPTGLYRETDISFAGTRNQVTGTDAGTYRLSLANQFTNTNPNFEVTFQTSDAQMTIQPRKVILTSVDLEKPYDGQPLKGRDSDVAGTGDGFVAGEGATISILGSQTEPGYSPHHFSYTLKSGTKDTNYTIETKLGMLRVLPRVNLHKTTPDWVALSGGKFRVTKWDGSMWAAVPDAHELVNTSTDGLTIPGGLGAGRYRIEELAAPDGYIVLDNSIYFAIEEVAQADGSGKYTLRLTDENGAETTSNRARSLAGQREYNHRIQIANQPGRAFPRTGGEGRSGILLVGGLFVGLALYGFRRRRQSR